MMEMHRKRGTNAVSSVIGGLIILAILFTTLVPLISFISQTAAEFENVVIERRIFDDQKRSEEILAAAYQNFTDGGKIYVWIKNVGAISVNILRVWVIDRANPDPIANPTVTADVVLPPFSDPLIVDTGVVPTVGKTYDVLILTERGNLITPDGSPLIGQLASSYVDVSKFPYALTLTLIGMRPGKIYNVTLEGNVPGGKVTYLHRSVAVAPNSSVTFAFGVNPGNYALTVRDETNTFVKTISLSVPETLHVTVRIPPEPDTAGVKIFVASPAAVRRGFVFYVYAFVVNTGTVRVCNMQLTILLSGSGFGLLTPPSATQALFPSCIDPGESSGPVYWRIKAASHSGKTASIRVEFSGEDYLGNAVSSISPPTSYDPIKVRTF